MSNFFNLMMFFAQVALVIKYRQFYQLVSKDKRLHDKSCLC